ncbi:MAG: hypothetical protein CFK49_04855 [Armatimonadetes bacterium JP3_11]|nr:MAG: hypothetical protein CFK48_02820 [Armatimonadetes bacterium CP1_7O]OYT75108.1 MAG: hypothetical protein CFK49_04855 [Armatimonadetes bacterium JP3_11]
MFKVPFGKSPRSLKMGFRPFAENLEDDGELIDDFSDYGGVRSFCVSWDGKWFYFADSLHSAMSRDASERETTASRVQVYHRDGTWVRSIQIVRGDPTRMRVDVEGRLYVQSNAGVEVYDADGRYDKSLSERFRNTVRTALDRHNLSETVRFLEVDTRGRVYFQVFPLLERTEQRSVVSANKILVAHPDGSSSLITIESYDPFGIDRYRAQIITANYSRPLQANYLRRHETTLVDAITSERLTKYVCSLYRTIPYKVVDLEGQTVRTFEWRVDIREIAPDYWDAYNEAYNAAGRLALAVDGQGHLYRVYLRAQIRRLVVSDPDASGYLRVDRGFGIFEFSPEGTLVRPRLLDVAIEAEFPHGNLWDVDKHGNVYWIEFHPDHLEVKMSPR